MHQNRNVSGTMRTTKGNSPAAFLLCVSVVLVLIVPRCRSTVVTAPEHNSDEDGGERGEGSDGSLREDGTLDNRTRDERILDSWSKFEGNLQDLVDGVIRKVLPTVIRRSSEVDVSPDCQDALLKVVFGIRQLKRWAFQCESFPSLRFFFHDPEK